MFFETCMHFWTILETFFQCNNPQTKEPKLESAMRIIGEWKDLDGEIRTLKDQFEATNLATSQKTIAAKSATKLPVEDDENLQKLDEDGRFSKL